MTQNLIRLFGAKSFHNGCWQRTVQSNLGSCGGSITSVTFRRYFQLCDRRVVGTCKNTPHILSKGYLRTYIQEARYNSSGKVKDMDQVLYTYDNPKFMRLISIFGFSFSAFWFFTSYQYATMRITPDDSKRVPTENLPWFARFDIVNSVSSKMALTILSALLGCGVLVGGWMFSIRSVGKVVLGKNGKTATFVTFNPLTLSMSKTITANINHISCQGHRSTNDIVPIKIKGKWMHFLLMKEGVYKNAPLFDRTVGLRRNL